MAPPFFPLFLDIMGLDPLVLDTLHTIQVAASLGPGSFGAYVISQATCASDVLAVQLLQVPLERDYFYPNRLVIHNGSSILTSHDRHSLSDPSLTCIPQ